MLIHAADEALNQAKASGRDFVHAASHLRSGRLWPGQRPRQRRPDEVASPESHRRCREQIRCTDSSVSRLQAVGAARSRFFLFAFPHSVVYLPKVVHAVFVQG